MSNNNDAWQESQSAESLLVTENEVFGHPQALGQSLFNIEKEDASMANDSIKPSQPASSQNWRMRVSSLSPEISKLLCFDERLQELEPDALGTLIRIHCLTRLGRNVPCDMKSAARLLSSTPSKLRASIKALLDAMPDLLISDGTYFFVPTLLTIQPAKEDDLSQKRSEAALARWKEDSGKPKKSKKSAISASSGHEMTPVGASIGPIARAQEDLQSSLFEGEKPSDVENAPSSGKSLSCPYQELANLFNTICGKLSKVGQANSWPLSRRSAMSNRWRERPDIDFWRDEVFSRVQRSDFLTGISTLWQANFDWIIKPVNLQKIIEGNYDNRGAARRALWDQGEKSRDRTTANTMVSEIHADSPFMEPKADPLNPLISEPASSLSAIMQKQVMFAARRSVAAPASPQIAPVIRKPLSILDGELTDAARDFKNSPTKMS